MIIISNYSIGKFAKLIGVSQDTLRRWDRLNQLPSHRTPGNHRYYTDEDLNHYLGKNKTTSSKPQAIYLYARVSSRTQLDDLQHQIEYLKLYAAGRGYQVTKVIQEQGSGLNYKRKHWNQLIDKAIGNEQIKVIVTYPDRFIRFGFDWFDNLFKKHGSEIEVINHEKLSANQELVQDLISIIQVFSSKLYGLRNYKTKLKADDKNGKFK